MQNSLVYNDIIPQIDPKTQEVIDNLKSKMQEIQNSETMKQARDMAEQCNAKISEIKGYSEMVKQAKTISEALNGVQVSTVSQAIQEKLGCVWQVSSVSQALKEKLGSVFSPELQDTLEQFRRNAEIMSEQVKAMMETAVVIVKKTVVNLYKKIVSCSRAVRSHKKTSVFSKSSSGDSGDPDPARPEPPHLTKPQTFIKLNSFLFSWQITPGYCSMVRGGKI